MNASAQPKLTASPSPCTEPLPVKVCVTQSDRAAFGDVALPLSHWSTQEV